MKKQNQTICCLQEIHIKYKDINTLKVNGKYLVYYANTNQNKARVAVFLSYKSMFLAKEYYWKKKEFHFIVKKRTIYQDDIGILTLNVYGFNNKMKKKAMG